MYADARHYKDSTPWKAIGFSVALHVLTGFALLMFYVPRIKPVVEVHVPIRVILLSHALRPHAPPQPQHMAMTEPTAAHPTPVQQSLPPMIRQHSIITAPINAAMPLLASKASASAAVASASQTTPVLTQQAQADITPAQSVVGHAAAAAAADTFVPAQADAAYLDNPRPEYPPLARRRHQEGTVKLEVRVSAQGTPLTVRLFQSSSIQVLDDAALAAVNGWRFVPAHRGAEAVEDTLIVPVRFKLTSAG